MAIDKVHGLQTTSMTLNERFTLLASVDSTLAPSKPQRRASIGPNNNYNRNYLRNRNLIEQVARHLEFQAKRQAVKQRLGLLRRFGSEGNLSGLRRSNSYSNISQAGFRKRTPWREPNSNFNWPSRFGSMWMGGFWRRGSDIRNQRERFRSVSLRGGRVQRMQGLRVQGLQGLQRAQRGPWVGLRNRFRARARPHPHPRPRPRPRSRGELFENTSLPFQLENATGLWPPLQVYIDRRVVSTQNRLPENVVMAPSLNSFKNGLDKLNISKLFKIHASAS
ncbi:hypothetical protein ACJJTC_010890 [Scirpophaga incertulas]